MILLQETRKSSLSPCQYLPGVSWQFDYFFAMELSEAELDVYLEQGWRKFGYYFFRPACPDCRKCIPIRIPTGTYRISRSQKRVMAKNKDIRVHFGPLAFSDRILEIYSDHSKHRFGKKEIDPADFFSSFYSPSCPTLQSEYYLGDTLVGIGFLDQSQRSLSSVYFIFDTAYSHLNLGTYSVIREIQEAKNLGLSYYYLGYSIEECRKMAYKNSYLPSEHYDWETQTWGQSGG